MHIATLHAMAEGARMILILSPLCGTAPAARAVTGAAGFASCCLGSS